MDEIKRIDNILKAVHEQVEEEIKILLGVEFTLSDHRKGLVSKEQFFDKVTGKQVVAGIELSGEVESVGCLVIGIKDAIRLGGTLIMLPDKELEEVAGREEYTAETEDSYGEIANIIAGSYTKIFEEMHNKAFRFVRKIQQVVLPLKVDIADSEPVPDLLYYQASCTMKLDGRQMGDLHMLLPADLFGLDQRSTGVAAKHDSAAKQVAGSNSARQQLQDATVEASAITPQSRNADHVFDEGEHSRRVDKILKECCERMQEEVSALLGSDVRFGELEHRFVSKEEFFFDVATGKQVVTDLRVVGDIEDTSYLFFTLRDAIYLGGMLIMLPPTELESVVVDEEFGDDTRDAFGEIAHIISGIYTTVFEEHYSEKVRFIKDQLGVVVPMKVDVHSDEPIPDVEYSMSSMTLGVEGQTKGCVHLLFPASMLKLDSARSAGTKIDAGSKSAGAADDLCAPVDILVISDDEVESRKFAAVARSRGLAIRQVSFKDNMKTAITQELKAIYIIMREVNEQAFGMAIKVSTSCALPLVAAGPDWTRSKVIKAVKYGANDILLTPATPEDIEENLENNLVRMAA